VQKVQQIASLTTEKKKNQNTQLDAAKQKNEKMAIVASASVGGALFVAVVALVAALVMLKKPQRDASKVEPEKSDRPSFKPKEEPTN